MADFQSDIHYSILQRGSRAETRLDTLAAWIAFSLEVLSSDTHTLQLPPRYT